MAHLLDRMAQTGAQYGVRVAYHNHMSEFYVDEGKTLLEHVADNSSECFLELDCGWCAWAGEQPVEFIRKFRNRIVAIHVRENNKVVGPGTPHSRHRKISDAPSPYGNEVVHIPVEQRRAMLAELTERAAQRTDTLQGQCPMGDPSSNIDWHAVRQALNEQDIQTHWIVERDGFYDTRERCLTEDLQWLRANIR